MTAGAARTVRHLRLRGPGEAEVRRAAIRLEDALRVATLPDPAGRVLLIRGVRLPPLDPRASSQTLAVALERAVEGAGVEAVHGEDPGARKAGAVWFADALEAHVVAARRTLGGAPLDAWFWPLAIPALADAEGSPLRVLARSLARLEVAPLALPAWVAAVARSAGAPGLSRLSGSLTAGDAALLAGAARLGPGPGEEEAGAGVHGGPGETGSPAAARDSAVRAAVRHLAVRGGEGRVAAEWEAAAAGSPVSGALPGAAAPRSPEESRAVGERTGADPGGTGARAHVRRPHESTRAAGLFFLLPVLTRLGFDDGSEAHPEWAGRPLARRVLEIWADRLGVPADDPVRLALSDGEDGPTAAAPTRWRAPEAFHRLRRRGGTVRWRTAGARGLRDRSGVLLLEFVADPDPAVPSAWDSPTRAEAVAVAWAVAMRRWLRRRGDLGIHALVRRPGRVATSSTHIDVTLPLETADVRIRRAGLDVDPGWLPWFRRVVRFHYGEGTPAGEGDPGGVP